MSKMLQGMMAFGLMGTAVGVAMLLKAERVVPEGPKMAKAISKTLRALANSLD